MSIVTVAIGYQKAYFLSILQGILCTVCAASLQEAMEGQRTFGERRIAADLFREVGAHFLQTAVFLRKVPEIAWRMAYSGLISAAVYVVYMLLQDHLVETGLEPGFLGIPLLLISLLFHGRSCADRKNRKNVSPVLLPGWWNSDRDLPLF